MMQGYVHPDFADVASALRRTVTHRRGGGAAVAVFHRGEPVVDIWAGTRDDTGAPWAESTTVMCFSTTKGVVATAAHRLADRGELDVAAPVAEYWPEFKAAGKEDVRVAHLLDHSAGMHRVRGVVENGEMLLDWDRTTAALAAAPPAYRPGSRHGYHAITYGYLVGEVLRRVTGQSVDDVVQAEVAGPLGTHGMSIGARGARRETLADLLPAWPPETRTERTVARLDRRRWLQPTIDAFMIPGLPEIVESGAIYDVESPALNGCFTARSLARMYSALATGETVGGARFLSEPAQRTATTVRTTSARRRARIPHALEARVSRGGDGPGPATARLRALRTRRLGWMGRSRPRTLRGDDVQSHGGDARRRPTTAEDRRRRGARRAAPVGAPRSDARPDTP